MSIEKIKMLRQSIGEKHHYKPDQILVVGKDIEEKKAIALVKSHCAVISAGQIAEDEIETGDKSNKDKADTTFNQLTKNFTLEELTNKAKEIGLPVAEKDTKKLIAEAILERRKAIELGVKDLMETVEHEEINAQAGEAGLTIEEGANITDVATALVIHNLKEATGE